MIIFNGSILLAIHEFPQAGAPELYKQDNHFAGINGVSRVVLGVGGREITFDVWLTDVSFTSAAALDAYRQYLDAGVGNGGDLVITGSAPAYFQDCSFEGFEATRSVLPVEGCGVGSYMQPGTFWQPGKLKFKQLSVV